MRIKGKVFSGFTALCVLLTFPVCASAAKADIQVIGGRNVRIITDFEIYPEKALTRALRYLETEAQKVWISASRPGTALTEAMRLLWETFPLILTSLRHRTIRTRMKWQKPRDLPMRQT